MVKTTRRPFDFDALVSVKKRDEIGGGAITGSGADAGKQNTEETNAGASKAEQKSAEKSDKK